MAEEFADLSKQERIEKAVAACITDTQNHKLSANKAAKIYNIAPSTITRRINEQTKSKKLVDESKQLLTPVEERTLVRWIVQYYKWGLPLGFKQIRQFAFEILAHKKSSETQNELFLFDKWHRLLLKRHLEIKRISARGLNRMRASAAHAETISEYFELFYSLQQKYGIVPQDTYNMNEKGFSMSALQRSNVVIPVAEREAFLRQDGNREWISIIETISASGESLSSYIIFKGVYQQNLLWLREHFDVETAKQQIDEYQLLLLDGHKSHCTLEFIKFCVEKKIILLVLPPHTTHLLQPLDVAIFSPLSRYYSAEIENHSREKYHWLEKEDFIIYYQNARKKALQENNIHSAWRTTELLPYNSQRVLSKLSNRSSTPSESAQIQLILNESSPLNLMIGANDDYVIKATQTIKNTMLKSSAKHYVKTIDYLNANNVILSATNTQLIAAARSRKQSRKTKKILGKTRVLSKEDADALEAEAKEKEAADIAHKIAMGQKKKEQTLKKAKEEADKAERAFCRAQAKDARETNAEMARMAKIKQCLFT